MLAMKQSAVSVYIVQHAGMGAVASVHLTRDSADEAKRDRGRGYEVMMWAVHE
jgi:hypothetical protein